MTHTKQKKDIWARPWGYPEAWLIIVALVLIGYLWQFIMGPIPQGFFSHPFSTIVLLSLLVVVAYVGLRGSKVITKKRPPIWVQFLLSPAATISSMVAFLVLLLIMGFTTQAPPMVTGGMEGFLHRSGWSSMVHSYPFNIIYIYFLLVLGSITIRRLTRFTFSLREVGFIINHLGLFCFLFFALLSGGAMKRYTMVLEQDEVEWRGVDYVYNQLVELPIAFTLKDFHMDEYPPQIVLVDGKTGKVLKRDGGVDFVLVENLPKVDKLMEWEVKIEEYLPLSAPIVTDETVIFKEFGSSGAAPAVRVTAQRGEEEHSGWVSCGSYLFPYRGLALADSISIVMPYPEPKQYYSKVEYIHRSGEQGEAIISVNHPLKTNGWYVYQLNYDQEKGRWGTSSELELVYDPYIKPVLISIWGLLLGAFFLLLGPANAPMNNIKQKKGGRDD